MAVVEVVKYNGTPDVFAWKYPNEELGTWTQLIVNETQEAILYKGGQTLDLFTAGRHTLTTANIPILNNIINLPFGGRSPFAAEVWYVNRIHSLDIKWGTPSPIQLQDPKYKIFLPLRSYGQFGIQIEDSRLFLTKLVGTLSSFDKDSVTKYFKGLYLTKVRDSISSYLVFKNISVLEINAYLDEISTHLQEKIGPVMAEYGIKLVNFYVNDINVPENDPAVEKLKAALTKKAEMEIVGYNYVQERSFDTLEGAATNPGAAQGGLMGAGIGLGMGMNLGNVIGGQLGQMINVGELKKCTACGNSMLAAQRYCSACGTENGKLATEVAAAAKDTTTCNECGHVYPRSFKFCPECGDKYNPCKYCGADIPDNVDVCPVCGKTESVCPKCSFVLTDPLPKFCPECGEALHKKCTTCNAALEGNPKFCPECGSKLQ